MLENIPFDIFLLMLKFLNPFDITQLLKTSKYLQVSYRHIAPGPRQIINQKYVLQQLTYLSNEWKTLRNMKTKNYSVVVPEDVMTFILSANRKKMQISIALKEKYWKN